MYCKSQVNMAWSFVDGVNHGSRLCGDKAQDAPMWRDGNREMDMTATLAKSVRGHCRESEDAEAPLSPGVAHTMELDDTLKTIQ